MKSLLLQNYCLLHSTSPNSHFIFNIKYFHLCVTSVLPTDTVKHVLRTQISIFLVSGSSARNVRDSSPSLLTGKMYAPRPAAADVERVCADMAEMKKLHVTIAALMEHHNAAMTTVLTNNNKSNAKLCEGNYRSTISYLKILIYKNISVHNNCF